MHQIYMFHMIQQYQHKRKDVMALKEQVEE